MEIEKEYGEGLGLEFDAVVFDRIRSCINRCLFCFVDQLPPGMRKTLYVKDDDYRLSFLYGNFISLTNLGRRDWNKILEMRLSPLYISVHATDPDTRSRIFGSEKARNVMRDLKRLREHNIEVHTQVVLCPGINDGRVLEQTIDDLKSLWPGVKSVGIVPVGITGHREGLPRLTPVTRRRPPALLNWWIGGRRSSEKTWGLVLFTWRTSFLSSPGRVFRNHGIMMITRSWRMVLGWPHVFWRNCRVCWRV